MGTMEERRLLAEEMFKKCLDLLERKSKDYSGTEDCNQNLKVCEKMGLAPAEVGILVRICDKISRLNNLIKTGQINVKEETAEDSIFDVINYCIILLHVYREKNPKIAVALPNQISACVPTVWTEETMKSFSNLKNSGTGELLPEDDLGIEGGLS